MIHIFAHSGESHSSDSESLIHTLKSDGLKILAVSLVFIIIALIITKTHKTKKLPSKDTKDE